MLAKKVYENLINKWEITKNPEFDRLWNEIQDKDWGSDDPSINDVIEWIEIFFEHNPDLTMSDVDWSDFGEWWN